MFEVKSDQPDAYKTPTQVIYLPNMQERQVPVAARSKA